MLMRFVLKMFGGKMTGETRCAGLSKTNRSFVNSREKDAAGSGIRNTETGGEKMLKKPEVKNIEWSETRPGIYKVNCPTCGKSQQFAAPDITPHQVLMSARELGWTVTRNYQNSAVKLFCSPKCAQKGGEKLGAQVEMRRATGSVKLEDGRTIQLEGTPEAPKKTKAAKGRGKGKGSRTRKA